MNTPAQQAFLDKQKQVQSAIDEYLHEARRALNKAYDLAEEHGVPFYSDITDIVSDWYVPSNVYTKNAEIDEDFLRDVAEIYSNNEYTDYVTTGGWQTSYC